jgi:hypothetical protein
MPRYTDKDIGNAKTWQLSPIISHCAFERGHALPIFLAFLSPKENGGFDVV